MRRSSSFSLLFALTAAVFATGCGTLLGGDFVADLPDDGGSGTAGTASPGGSPSGGSAGIAGRGGSGVAGSAGAAGAPQPGGRAGSAGESGGPQGGTGPGGSAPLAGGGGSPAGSAGTSGIAGSAPGGGPQAGAAGSGPAGGPQGGAAGNAPGGGNPGGAAGSSPGGNGPGGNGPGGNGPGGNGPGGAAGNAPGGSGPGGAAGSGGGGAGGGSTCGCEGAGCTVNTCVSSVPAGWLGPVVLKRGLAGTTGDCPNPFEQTFRLYGDLKVPDATCSGCACSPLTLTGWKATISDDEELGLGCSSTAGFSAARSDATCVTVSGKYDHVRFDGFTGDTVDVAPMKTNVPKPFFEDEYLACAVPPGSGACGVGGCLPPPAGFDDNVCIYKADEGNGEGCMDQGEYGFPLHVYASPVDQRTCSTCTCSVPAAVSAPFAPRVVPASGTCGMGGTLLAEGVCDTFPPGSQLGTTLPSSALDAVVTKSSVVTDTAFEAKVGAVTLCCVKQAFPPAGGRQCVNPSDCVSGACSAAGACVAASCSDSAKNGDETGVDCGGGCPAGCPNGERCTANADCASDFCSAGTCVP